MCFSAVCIGFLSTPLSASSLEAFAGVVGGGGNGVVGPCTTYGSPSPVSFFQGAGFSVPVGGIAACNYSGGTVDLFSPGSFPATQTLGTVSWSGQTYSGSADASASYGVLHSDASGTFTGFSNSLTLAESAGASLWDDSMTFTTPLVSNGASGFVILTFTVHGTLSSGPVQNSTAYTSLTVKHGTTPYASHNLKVFDGTSTVDNTTPPAGMTVTVNGMSGTVMFSTVQIPIIFGTAEQLQAGLLAETGRTGSNDFSSTATLTGISVVDSSQNPINNFSIASTSGTAYSANGVTPAPEPAAGWLLGAGLTVLAGRRYAIRRQR